MTVGIYFSVCSLIYTSLLVVVFFTKPRFNSYENKVYRNLVITSLFGPLIGIPTYIFMGNMDTYPMFNIIFSKLYLIYLAMWLMFFTLYIFSISIKDFSTKKMSNIFIIVTGILILLVTTLPLYYHNADGIIYSFGPASNFLYLISSILVVIIIYCLIKNIKYITEKKFFPIIAFLIIGTVVMIIQKLNPGLLLLSFAESFITFLMYFTIENPDIKMIGELYKNRKLIESSNEGTSRFLFKLTQDIKKPTLELKKISNEMTHVSDKEMLKEYALYVNNYSNQLDYLVNNALNISSMNTQKIKVFNSKYNIYRLFKEISIYNESLIKGGITFKYNIDESIPTYLYGDSIRLKQIINSIINNSIKNTNAGFISFDISSIIKYDVCRLFISIEDSGDGMDIEKINNLMSLDDEASDIDVNSLLDKNDLNYKEIKRLAYVIGGAILIKSEENKGSNVVITLDQKIVPNEDVKMLERLENYEQLLRSGIKCLVIDEDEEELKRITKVLKEKDYNVDASLFEMDCIEKVSKKFKYDFIILDDEMPNYSAIDILKKLKENKDFKTPVIVMINDNKDKIKLQYLKDGFADYILKSKLESEIKRVTKRF